MSAVQILSLVAMVALAAAAVAIACIAWQRRPRRAAAVPAEYSPPGLGLLALNGEQTLIVGAIVDLAFGLIAVSVLNSAFHLHLPLAAKIVATVMVAAPIYAWSVNLGWGRNHVPPFQRGIVTRVGRLVPSGPDGAGLMPGYYWLPLGWPFLAIVFKDSVKEITVLFDQMQVWAKNSTAGTEGAIEGQTDGVAQFEIINLAQYLSVAKPEEVLKGITLESARDACEKPTIEAFIGTPNETLAKEIYDKIVEVLGRRIKPLGVRCISVNVKKTDPLSAPVRDAWAQIKSQASLAIARKTDADARAERIKTYKAAGIDANRAVAADLVADDKTGATVSDQRFNADVGSSLKEVLEGLASRFGGRP